MTKEKAIEMINEYLLEPNSIDKNWVEALKMCRQALKENENLNVELVGMRGACESYKMHYDNAQAEIKDLKKQIKTMLDVEKCS